MKRTLILMTCAAAVALLLRIVLLQAAVVTITAAADLQAAINRSVAHDVITVDDGTCSGGLNFSGKSDITVVARHYGSVIIDGGQVQGGSRITLKGLVIQHARTNLQIGAVISGPDWLMEDCNVVDNESLGISCSGPRSTFVRVRSLRNGYLGWGCGTPDGITPFDGPTLIDCETAFNNNGRLNPIWKNDTPGNGQVVKKNGLYYAVPGWEGGGAKFCSAAGMTIVRMKAHHNGGPGLWLDVYDRKVDFVDCESYSNFGVTAAWEGCGFATEICFGPTTFTNCYSHDNTGSDFAVWEAKNTTIKDCVSTGAGIELRNIGGDRGGAKMADKTKGWYVQNLTISGHRFYNAGKVFWSINSPFPGQISNVSEVGSLRGLSLPATWSSLDQPATQPATQPTTQIAELKVSAAGTAVPPADFIVDPSFNTWRLVGGQIARNGTIDPITRDVQLLYLDGVAVHQQTSVGWWKWNNGWVVTADPRPTTQPATAPATQPAATQPTIVITVPKEIKADVRVDRP